jgi:hypothetical protein
VPQQDYNDDDDYEDLRRLHRLQKGDLRPPEQSALGVAENTLQLTTASIEQLRAAAVIIARARIQHRSGQVLALRLQTAAQSIDTEIHRRTRTPADDEVEVPRDRHDPDTAL